MLSALMLSALMLSVVILSAIILSAVASKNIYLRYQSLPINTGHEQKKDTKYSKLNLLKKLCL